MHTPDLSIIIPTRNRYVTALACAKQVLSCEGDFELIVRDCSDSDKLREPLENLEDERLRYDYQKPPVSMTDNWEAAVSLAQGDYICLIGDDDGISPITPKIAGYLKELKIQALVSPSSASTFYWWPDFPSKDATKIIVRDCLGSLRKEAITSETIKQTIMSNKKNSGGKYLNLPRIYNGIVARDLVDRLRKLNGRVFKSQGPDTYFTYALTSILKESYIVDYPITIYGASQLSNSGRFFKNRGDKGHAKEFSSYKFHPLVPPVSSMIIVIIDSIFQALEDNHQQDLMKGFPIEKLYAIAIGQSLSHWKIIVGHLHNQVLADKNIFYKLKIYIGVIYYIVNRSLLKVIIKPVSKLFFKKEKTFTYNAQDINEASVKLFKHLNDRGVTKKVIEAFEKLR